MKKLLLFCGLLFLWAQIAQAQVTTNEGSGLAPTYPSLAAAITALNAATITSPVVITLTGNETAPAGGYSITQLNGSAANTIIIQGSGSTITAFTPQTAGLQTDAVFKIVGGDWITIQNFTMQENASNTVTTHASNTMTEFGVALYLTTTTNGAQNNTIQNNTITLGSTYQSAIGIFSTSSSSLTNGTLAAASSAGTNSNNKFYSNTISNVAYGMYFICEPMTATVFETNNDMGGTSGATANTITFGNATTATLTWNRFSTTQPAGIVFRNGGAGNSVRFNTITSNSLTYAQTSGLGGIITSIGTAATGVTYTSNWSDNIITLSNNGTTAITGIDFGYGLSTGTIVSNLNNITLNQTTSAAASAAIMGIKANYASATNTLNTNTITVNQSPTTTGSVTSPVTGITGAGIGTTVNANSNVITFKQNAPTGTATYGAGAISYIDVGAASGTVNVNSNQLLTTGSTIRSTGTCSGVIHTAGTITVGITINLNTMTIDRVAASGSIFGTNESSTPSTVAHTITNNNITFTNLAGTTIANGIRTLGGASATTTSKTINGNTINISGVNTGQTIGIIAGFGYGNINNNNITVNNSSTDPNGIWANQTGAGAFTMSLNNVSLTSNSVAPTNMIGISGGATGPFQIFNNTFSAMNFTGIITTSPTVSGISVSVGTGNNIYNNVITNISTGVATSTGSPIVRGIIISGGVSTNVYKNKIYGIITPATGSTTLVSGITISGGGTASPFNQVYNNLIGDLTAPAATNTDAIRGINITSTTASSTNNIYYNTVHLSGAGGTNFGSSGIFHAASATATTAALNMRNNIIVNNCTPNGTGLAVAFRRSSGIANMLSNYASTSNNNLFFAGVIGGSANQLIYSDGTSTAQTMAAYKAGVFTAGTIAPRDAASFSEDPVFQSISGASTDFLKFDVTTPKQIESGAAAIAGITDDYVGTVRPGGSGTAPDVGAWELEGIPLDLAGPSISYTTLGNAIAAGTRLFGNVGITDASGVNTTAGTRPRVYYKKSTDANDDTGWKSVEASGVGGTPFSFTIDYTLLNDGSVAEGNIIQYFVVAQDLAGTPNVGINSGVFAAAPASVALTAAAFPITGTINSFTIVGTVSGLKTVGSGGDYASLTGAGGAFADINAKVVAGSIVLEIISDLTETGANALNQWSEEPASSNYTLSILPSAASTRTISGSFAGGLIRLNGADRVTIDGSNGSTPNTVCPASAATRDLTITNTNTGTTSAVIWLQTATADGATNNIIRNCNLVGSGVTQTLFGVGAGSSTIGLTSLGTGNNNNAYINNNISGVQYGIYTQGASAANKNTGTLINQNVITASANTKGGIITGFENNITISGNVISNIAQASAPDVFAIAVGMTAISATGTTGNEVTNATVTNNIIGSVVNSGTYSAAGITVASATLGTTTIANNMISGVMSNGTSGDFSAGIILGGGTGSTTNVYHNTVSMQGTIAGGTAAAQTSACLAVTNSTAPTINLRNNIFSNIQLGNAGATLRFAAIALGYSTYATLTSDNNDLFCAGAGPGTYQVGITGGVVAGTSRTTLGNWQTETGKDAASKNVAPVYSGTPFPLSIDANNASNGTHLNATGASGTGVSNDIDCETRDALNPDMGADEFTPPGCVTAEGGTASGSTAFCVSGTPTITASGYSTGTGSTYQWMSSTILADYPEAGSPVSGQTNPAALTTGVVSTTTYYWLRVTCATNASTANSTMVTITINPLPATVTVNGAGTYCGSATLTADNGSDGTIYFQGTTSNGTSTATPSVSQLVTASGTYYFRAQSAAGCWSAQGSAVVTINPIPSAVTITPPAPAPIAAGDVQQLVASGGTIQSTGVFTLGTGSSTTIGNSITSSLGPNPFQSYYGGSKQQMLITASDLSPLGIVNGAVISSISIQMNTVEARTLNSLVVKMKNTSTTAFGSTSFETGLTTVRNAANYTPTTGWSAIALDNNFTYTGGSLLIEINFSNNDGGGDGTSTAFFGTTSYASTLFYRVDSQTAAFVDAATTASFAAYTQRNNIRFSATITAPTFITWSPATGLFTDNPPTTAYDPIIHPNQATVYAQPAETTMYTATATSTAGCTNSANVTVTVNQIETTWTGALNNDWTNASNWTNGSPVPTSRVVIPSTATKPIISSTEEVAQIGISSGGSLTIAKDGRLTVSGSLTNSSGNAGLLIKSDATGTGSLLHNTDNVPATIERYITGLKYHFVSVPLTQASNPTAALFMNSYLLRWNPAGPAWVWYTAPGDALSVNQGLMNYYTAANVTYNFAGAMNNGSFTAATPAPDGGFSLVPNPYPSAINWDAAAGWTKTNIANAVYVYNNNQYASYVGGVGVNGGSNFIPVGQAFFVKSDGGTGTLTMNNSVRVHDNQAFYKNHVVDNVLRISTTANGKSDETAIRLLSEATAAFDAAFDANKMLGANDAPQLYSIAGDNQMLSINTLPLLPQGTVVPLAFKYSVAGTITLQFSGLESLTTTAEIFLEDVLTGSMTNLRQQANYSFTHSVSNQPERFKLHIGIVTNLDDLQSKYRIWTYDRKIYIDIPAYRGEKVLVEQMDLLGKTLQKQSVVLSGPTIVPASTAGVAIVKVTTADRVYTAKLFIQ